MNVLELFCGTKSITKIFDKHGHKTFTIDINNIFNPDLCDDILNVSIDDIPFKPDVIWASPPCECFSVASISTHWTGGWKQYIPKTEKCLNAMDLVNKTIALIVELKPEYWFIENPRGVLRKIGIMKYLPKHTVTYCQYGDSRMKPTDIWTNCDIWIPKLPCKNGDSCHEPAPRGSHTGTQGLKDKVERGRIPVELCGHIVESCERGMRWIK